MKKIISVLLSITLAVLCFSSLVLSADTAETAQDGRSYVIWEANPLNLSNPSLSEFGGMLQENIEQNSKNSAQIKSDINGAYYEVTLGQNGGYGAVFASSIIGNTYDFTGWLADQAFVNTILPYLTVKCDLRRVDSGVVKPGFDIGLIPLWNNDSKIAFVKANGDENSQVNASRGEWISCEGTRHGADKIFGDHLSDGLFYVSAWGEGDDAVLADTPVVIDVRNLRIEVKESDRLAFNEALKDAEYTPNGSWGWNNDISFGSDEKSNTDYFGAVIKYNDIAEYTTEKKLVIFEADPTRVSNENGTSAKPEWALDETHHQWTFGYKTSGVGTVAYGADGQCYNSHITHSYSGNGALLKTGVTSGYTVNGSKMGWMANNQLLAALAPYMEVKYDVYTTVDSYVSIIPLPEDTENGTNPYKEYAVFDAQSVTAGNWVTMSRKGMDKNFTADYGPNWSKGDILVIADNDDAYGQGAENNVKIRNFRIELSVWDKEEINAALAQVNGIDSIGSFTDGEALGTDANGNRDYFSLLTRFDAASVNSVNAAKGDVNLDTNVNILDLVSLKKYSANGNNHINFKAANCNGDAVFGDSADLVALKQLLLGIKF